jgi:hypothetical protein
MPTAHGRRASPPRSHSTKLRSAKPRSRACCCFTNECGPSEIGRRHAPGPRLGGMAGDDGALRGAPLDHSLIDRLAPQSSLRSHKSTWLLDRYGSALMHRRCSEPSIPSVSPRHRCTSRNRAHHGEARGTPDLGGADPGKDQIFSWTGSRGAPEEGAGAVLLQRSALKNGWRVPSRPEGQLSPTAPAGDAAAPAHIGL